MSASPFLSLPGAVEGVDADAGVPAHYGDPIREQRALEQGALVDASTRGVIAVSGPDRLGWLDSMLSQKLDALRPGEAAEALLLDPNGRLEQAAAVLDDGSTTYLIVERAAEATLATFLDRMRFRLQVEVARVSDELAVVATTLDADAVAGFAAAPAGLPLVWRDPWPDVTPGGVRYAHDVGDAWGVSLVLVPRADLGALVDRVRTGELAVAGTLALEARRVAALRPRAAAEVDERTIPHELDWLTTAVHLAKGCYRGQETIAKVHNLGHPPRRLVLLQLDGSDATAVAAGDEVRDGEKVVGRVTTPAQHRDAGPIALAVVKRSTPVDAVLVVAADGGDVVAAQEVVVPPEAGAAVDVPLRRRR